MAKVSTAKKISLKPTAKAKQPRASRTVSKSVDLKAYGPEPVDIKGRFFASVLNWYNYMHDPDETRPWLFDYMKSVGYTKQDIAAARRYPKNQISRTTCTLARILYNGNELPGETMDRFVARIKEIVAGGYTVKDDADAAVVVNSKPELTIQERTQAKTQQLISACEEAIDLDPHLNIYEWLQGKEATSQAATAICDYYSKWIKDFEYDDGFESRIQKKARLEKLKYWTQFVYDCERFVGNKKVAKVRKPREKKAKPAIDLVKGLKYQKEFPPLKIVSVNPTEIIGAVQVWTYNTKYKKLTRYDASGPSGIQVKGASITSFDVEKSSTKSLRKPEVTIQSLLGAGKVALRKIMDDVKTNESKPTGRINTDTILLRIIR
jgi:hypothetical protein